jgi:hypothetical protein
LIQEEPYLNLIQLLFNKILLEMMLKEEKHTAHAVAFAIDLGEKTTGGEPQIKKRLEADAKAAHGPSITLDKIKEKLSRAEQKRKQTLQNSTQL